MSKQEPTTKDDEYYDMSIKQESEEDDEEEEETENFEMLGEHFGGTTIDSTTATRSNDSTTSEFNTTSMGDLLNEDYETMWRSLSEANERKKASSTEDQRSQSQSQSQQQPLNSKMHKENAMGKRSYGPLHYDAKKDTKRTNYTFAERPTMIHSGHEPMNQMQRMRYLHHLQSNHPMMNQSILNEFAPSSLENPFRSSEIFDFFPADQQPQEKLKMSSTRGKKKKKRI